MFLDEARAVVAHAEQAAGAVQRASRGEIGQLVVGCALWADFLNGARIIRRFARRHPGVDVELRDLTAPEQIALLEDGTIHVGILRPPVQSDVLMSERLVSESLVVAFPRSPHRSALRPLLATPSARLSVPREPGMSSCRDHASGPVRSGAPADRSRGCRGRARRVAGAGVVADAQAPGRRVSALEARRPGPRDGHRMAPRTRAALRPGIRQSGQRGLAFAIGPSHRLVVRGAEEAIYRNILIY